MKKLALLLALAAQSPSQTSTPATVQQCAATSRSDRYHATVYTVPGGNPNVDADVCGQVYFVPIPFPGGAWKAQVQTGEPKSFTSEDAAKTWIVAQPVAAPATAP